MSEHTNTRRVRFIESMTLEVSFQGETHELYCLAGTDTDLPLRLAAEVVEAGHAVYIKPIERAIPPRGERRVH